MHFDVITCVLFVWLRTAGRCTVIRLVDQQIVKSILNVGNSLLQETTPSIGFARSKEAAHHRCKYILGNTLLRRTAGRWGGYWQEQSIVSRTYQRGPNAVSGSEQRWWFFLNELAFIWHQGFWKLWAKETNEDIHRYQKRWWKQGSTW